MDRKQSNQNAGLSGFLDRIRSNETGFGILLAILVGAIAGFGALAFRWLISTFQSVFFGDIAGYFGFLGQYYIILLPAIGGLII